jgi:hypothetical protein
MDSFIQSLLEIKKDSTSFLKYLHIFMKTLVYFTISNDNKIGRKKDGVEYSNKILSKINFCDDKTDINENCTIFSLTKKEIKQDSNNIDLIVGSVGIDKAVGVDGNVGLDTEDDVDDNLGLESGDDVDSGLTGEGEVNRGIEVIKNCIDTESRTCHNTIVNDNFLNLLLLAEKNKVALYFNQTYTDNIIYFSLDEIQLYITMYKYPNESLFNQYCIKYTAIAKENLDKLGNVKNETFDELIETAKATYCETLIFSDSNLLVTSLTPNTRLINILWYMLSALAIQLFVLIFQVKEYLRLNFMQITRLRLISHENSGLIPLDSAYNFILQDILAKNINIHFSILTDKKKIMIKHVELL